MADSQPSKPRAPKLAPASRGVKIAVAAAFAVGITLALLRQPNLSLLLSTKPVILVHLGFALIALGLGAVLLVMRKGHRFHRVAGWVWVILIMTVAASSLFITEINGDRWSFIHLITGWTLIAAPFAVFLARKHMVRQHRSSMMSIFYGGLIIAGAFTFLPGRLMYAIFFGG